jgi:hypothetical protein
MKLTAPSMLVFIVALILAGLAVASLYTTIPYIGHYISPRRFWVMTAAFALLAASVVFRRL